AAVPCCPWCAARGSGSCPCGTCAGAKPPRGPPWGSRSCCTTCWGRGGSKASRPPRAPCCDWLSRDP
ncbi:hypothetical protein DV515_00017965, partial [Chloebia gouldiae]